MSEIKDRQDAASDIDPIVAAQADDTVNDNRAAAAVEGLGHADDADAAIEASDDVPATESTVIDEAGTAESETADTTSADFELVAAVAADAVADALAVPVEAGEPASDTAVLDITLASEAMPAELAADADVTADDGTADDLGPVVLPVVRIPSAAETGPFEHTTAAYADTVVELEAPGDEFNADDDSPLLDGELEDGIASVFAALHAAAMDGATPPVEPLGDLEAADGVTFRLLGELDRLWHRAA